MRAAVRRHSHQASECPNLEVIIVVEACEPYWLGSYRLGLTQYDCRVCFMMAIPLTVSRRKPLPFYLVDVSKE